jgi:hypothetical protein
MIIRRLSLAALLLVAAARPVLAQANPLTPPAARAFQVRPRIGTLPPGCDPSIATDPNSPPYCKFSSAQYRGSPAALSIEIASVTKAPPGGTLRYRGLTCFASPEQVTVILLGLSLPTGTLGVLFPLPTSRDGSCQVVRFNNQ